MIINEEESRYLINLTEWIIGVEIDILHGVEDDEPLPQGFDPNDVVIYDSFILKILEKNRDLGMNTNELLDKGVHMMSNYIPRYIIAQEQKLSEPEKGFLIKFYLLQEINSLSAYIQDLENGQIMDHIPTLRQYSSVMTNMLENIKPS